MEPERYSVERFMASMEDLDRRRRRWNLWVRVPTAVIGGGLIGIAVTRVIDSGDRITLGLLIIGILLAAVGGASGPTVPRNLEPEE